MDASSKELEEMIRREQEMDEEERQERQCRMTEIYSVGAQRWAVGRQLCKTLVWLHARLIFLNRKDELWSSIPPGYPNATTQRPLSFGHWLLFGDACLSFPSAEQVNDRDAGKCFYSFLGFGPSLSPSTAVSPTSPVVSEQPRHCGQESVGCLITTV